MTLCSAKTIEEYSKALYIKLKLMNTVNQLIGYSVTNP